MRNRGECLSATEANQNFSKADDEAMRLLVDYVDSAKQVRLIL